MSSLLMQFSGFLVSVARLPYFDGYFFATLFTVATAFLSLYTGYLVYRNFDRWVGWNQPVAAPKVATVPANNVYIVSAFS